MCACESDGKLISDKNRPQTAITQERGVYLGALADHGQLESICGGDRESERFGWSFFR
jgi:hypothetical protein